MTAENDRTLEGPRSEAVKRAHPLSFFDPEHVERPVPAHSWRALAAAALAGAALFTVGWEFYWRGKELTTGDYKQSVALWAKERAKATGEATVLVGSSRIFFGADLDIWEKATGTRPIQLAMEGTSPRVVLADLAADKNFRGQVICGVTVPLFFNEYAGRRANFVERWKKVSYADKFDLFLSRPLENMFAFIDDQARLKVQISYWAFPPRDGMKKKFDPRKLEAVKWDRNTKLWRRVETDPRYAEEAKEIWRVGTLNNMPPPGPDGKPPQMPDQAIEAVIGEVKKNIDAIRARGGDVAFVRMPFTGAYNFEYVAFPRERFWDRLLSETQSVGVSFEDYPALQGYVIPEDSHLSESEAIRFTAALTPILYEKIEAAKRGSP